MMGAVATVFAIKEYNLSLLNAFLVSVFRHPLAVRSMPSMVPSSRAWCPNGSAPAFTPSGATNLLVEICIARSFAINVHALEYCQ